MAWNTNIDCCSGFTLSLTASFNTCAICGRQKADHSLATRGGHGNEGGSSDELVLQRQREHAIRRLLSRPTEEASEHDVRTLTKERGNSLACATAGLCYYAGIGVPADLDTALEMWEQVNVEDLRTTAKSSPTLRGEAGLVLAVMMLSGACSGGGEEGEEEEEDDDDEANGEGRGGGRGLRKEEYDETCRGEGRGGQR